MSPRWLIRAWVLLLALTALGTALHFSPLPVPLRGGLILGAAAIKGRLILLDYLELRGVEFWAGGIQLTLAALLSLLLVLYLAA